MALNKFRTKARAVELLGRKQIRDDITALIELMKNSYDADAEMVVVDFTLNEDSPYLIIYDDGQGMTESELLNKWLVIGTDSKKKEKHLQRSRKKGRKLMGEKGIGRLASAALGEELLMFTKAFDDNWNMLFLNWNVFENTNLFLDDISIPVVLNESREDILSQENIARLIEAQKQNLELKGWFEKNDTNNKSIQELFITIKSQINEFKLPIDHLDAIVQLLNDIGQGTIIIVKHLRQRWNDIFDTLAEDSDVISKTKRIKLGSFIDTFKDVSKDFDVHFFVDNKTVEFSNGFNEELYNIYDLKIKGTIADGKFHGMIHSPAADETVLEECNQILRSGIEVTNGIANWKEKDCGPFDLELCHIEMLKKNSSISEEDRAKIEVRLDNSGGIMVFRDDVRVLPYGELENDFLNLEMRRSKNAGAYLFSHRNMFGRIFLDSERNPKLEDKSSREGLLENEQYHYFIKTLQNLLVKIAFEFLSDSRNESKKLRGTYIAKNNIEHERKKIENEAIKREESAAKKEIARLKNDFKIKVKQFHNDRDRELEIKFENVPLELKYKLLTTSRAELKRKYDQYIKSFDEKEKDLQVSINTRFLSYIDEDLLEQIYIHNSEVKDYFDHLIKLTNESYGILENQYKFKLDKWQKSVASYLEQDFEKYESLTKVRINYLRDKLTSRDRELVEYLDRKINDKKSELIYLSSFNQTLSNCKEELIKKDKIQLNELNKKLEKSLYLLDELRQIVPSELKRYARLLEEDIIDVESILHKSYSESMIENQLNHLVNEELDQIVKELKEKNIGDNEDTLLISALSEKIASLEKENEVYSDLANIGMAAEIVNHEFNQLFTNVNDAIKNLKGISGSSERYWVEQIETGFKAISARHTQLSPMYRSFNLRKRPINIYDMVEDMLTFFESRIIKNNIKIINEIEDDIRLILSPSKMYPVFSNLIDNAIYWVLNQKEKVILFHFDKIENAIYIEDSGPGISTRAAQKIFTPFYSGRPEGRGLGLTIVKKVLESQKNEILVINDVNDKRLNGACFKIIFNNDDKVGI